MYFLAGCDDGVASTIDSCDPVFGCVFKSPGTPYCELLAPDSGSTVVCAFSLGAADETAVAAALQFDIHYDSNVAGFAGFHDPFEFFPGGPWVENKTPPGTLYPSGHSLTFSMQGDGSIRVQIFNLAAPENAISPVVAMTPDEAAATPESVFVEARFVSLLGAEGQSFSVYVSKVAAASATAEPLKILVPSGGPIYTTSAIPLDCETDSDCVDDDICTKDYCGVGGTCKHSFAVPDDGDYCTFDLCDAELGYYYVPLDCGPSDACKQNSCDPSIGVCVTIETLLDDGDSCTVDFCDSNSGPFHIVADCNDGNDCTVDTCVEDFGCINISNDCDDGVPCTVDSCSGGDTCEHAPNDDACDDLDPLTEDGCAPELQDANSLGCVNL